ncbi:MAG: nucleotidyltransferase domain-containing protein [bacterium]
MKNLEQLKLKDFEKRALEELKQKIKEKFPDAEIILYGSKVRGDFDEESDIDLLILVDGQVNSKVEEEISKIAYEIELKYDVVFGKVVENKNFWNSKLAKAMPFHQNVDKEGVSL